MFNTINHCRLCRADSIDVDLFKYGVRHYVCAACGFARYGRAFLDRLPLHEVQRLPFRRVLDAGFTLETMQQYVEARRARERS